MLCLGDPAHDVGVPELVRVRAVSLQSWPSISRPGDGDDLGTLEGEASSSPISVLLLDLEAGVGEKTRECVDVEEAKVGTIYSQRAGARLARRLGERDDVADDRFNLVRDTDRPSRRVNDIDRVRRVPALPRSRKRISGLERETTTVDERSTDRAERRPELVIADRCLPPRPSTPRRSLRDVHSATRAGWP